jgi:hypothetical protein
VRSTTLIGRLGIIWYEDVDTNISEEFVCVGGGKSDLVGGRETDAEDGREGSEYDDWSELDCGSVGSVEDEVGS